MSIHPIITDLANSCQHVEHTLWLEHSENYNYINAYNLGYLSRLAYSRVKLDESYHSGIVEYNFRQFITIAQNPFIVCHMGDDWNRFKMRRITDEGKSNSVSGLTPFITLVEIGKGIQHPSPKTSYVDDEQTSTSALFYCDDTRAVIAVRGTYELWHDGAIIDADAEQIKPEFNIKGELHRGFYTQARTIIGDDRFDDFVEQLKGKDLYLTGHSLGGAVATILSAYLYEKGLKPLLYTYGSPRVGNINFAKYYADKFTHFRHVNGGDWVPALPGRVLDGSVKTILNKYFSYPNIMFSVLGGLINLEGDLYTHHGNLCQFINQDEKVLMLPFFQHEITQLSMTEMTLEGAKSENDRAHDLADPRTHSMDAYLLNVKNMLIKLYQFYQDNQCNSVTPESCTEHPLHHLIQEQINITQNEVASLEKPTHITTLIFSSPTRKYQRYNLWIKKKELIKLYQDILAKLEKLDSTVINRYELYSKRIGHPDIQKQLDDLIKEIRTV